MKIATFDKSRYAATFNGRNLVITGDRALKAVDTATSEILDGPELRSVKRLVDWHLKSQRLSNELNAYWTVN